MARRKFGTRLIFKWMEARTASAHALVAESIWLVHGHALDTDRDELIVHLIEAAIYLRVLGAAIADEEDRARACDRIGRLGARHRPRLEWRADPNEYLLDVFRAARRDVDQLKTFMARVREKEGPVAEGLAKVLAHLTEAERLCETGGSAPARA